MDFVVDTNILFSYFKEDSFVNKAVKSGLFGLSSPELALVELEKHSDEICAKSDMSKTTGEYTGGMILSSPLRFRWFLITLRIPP